MKPKIGIIGGHGFVGQAMIKLFPDATSFGRDANYEEVNSCDAIFICVPTDLTKKGNLDTSIVESIVSKCTVPLIIIRSTLNPGTCDYLEEKYHRNLVMMPEYVGESVAHPLLDEKTRPFLIIGGRPENRRKTIEIFHQVYNANIKIRQVTNYEAEVIKLAENRAIAWKLMECQELFDICQKAGVDYYTVRDAVYGDDPRFNLWWSFVYPQNKGFQSSKCLRKDVPAFCYWARMWDCPADVTELLVAKSRQAYQELVDYYQGKSHENTLCRTERKQ